MPGPGPLPPPPLGARPEGFVDLLKIKAGGRFPQHLADDWLLPTFDLSAWYQDLQAVTVRATLVNNALGATVAIATVPQGECWAIRQASIIGLSNAPAGITRLGAEIVYTDTNSNPIGVLVVTPVGAGPDIIAAGQSINPPIILQPGQQLVGNSTTWVGAGANSQVCAVRYLRLPL